MVTLIFGCNVTKCHEFPIPSQLGFRSLPTRQAESTHKLIEPRFSRRMSSAQVQNLHRGFSLTLKLPNLSNLLINSPVTLLKKRRDMNGTEETRVSP